MYLVTGASGHLGRAVINHLLTTYNVPAKQIIAASRDIAKLADLKAKGVELRTADFGDAAGLAGAFTGANRVLLISTDSFAPGERQKQHANAVKAAESAGVEHVLYTSMPAPDTSAVLFAPDHLNTEKAIAASRLPGWTVLRHNWYFENLFMSLPHALQTGSQYSAAAQGKIAHIARDDLARADAAALINATGKKTYTLTGNAAFTTDEIAALVSKATGKPLNVVHVPVEGLVQGMIGAGLPEGMARLFASFDANSAQGGLATITDDYKTLTGAEPGAFSDWLAANATAFHSSPTH
jgi:NAD(P)H dehydrogenase (quinone)